MPVFWEPKLPDKSRPVLEFEMPDGWTLVQKGENGVACINKSKGLTVITSIDNELDGKFWLHVSVSRKSRLPSWEDLRYVKDEFIGKDKKAMQVLPPQAEYVNIHDYVLHLWHCIDGDPLPDFTRGTGMI